jgi:hypothetical protein
VVLDSLLCTHWGVQPPEEATAALEARIAGQSMFAPSALAAEYSTTTCPQCGRPAFVSFRVRFLTQFGVDCIGVSLWRSGALRPLGRRKSRSLFAMHAVTGQLDAWKSSSFSGGNVLSLCACVRGYNSIRCLHHASTYVSSSSRHARIISFANERLVLISASTLALCAGTQLQVSRTRFGQSDQLLRSAQRAHQCPKRSCGGLACPARNQCSWTMFPRCPRP